MVDSVFQVNMHDSVGIFGYVFKIVNPGAIAPVGVNFQITGFLDFVHGDGAPHERLEFLAVIVEIHAHALFGGDLIGFAQHRTGIFKNAARPCRRAAETDVFAAEYFVEFDGFINFIGQIIFKPHMRADSLQPDFVKPFLEHFGRKSEISGKLHAVKPKLFHFAEHCEHVVTRFDVIPDTVKLYCFFHYISSLKNELSDVIGGEFDAGFLQASPPGAGMRLNA